MNTTLETIVEPIPTTSFQMMAPKLHEIRTRLEELLDLGMIKSNVSPWDELVSFVKKKDGILQLYIDYRYLNKVSMENNYLTPHINDYL